MIATIKVLEQDKDLNYDVVVTCIRSNENRNHWNYQNIPEFANTFLGTPILCAYVNGQIADGHNMREATMPNGEQFYDFTGATAERIVGAISDDPNDIEIVTNEEGDWVIAKGKLWRFYNRQLVDKIAEAGSLEVSAETEVMESYMEDGIEVFTKWRGLGVTILNEKVAPAIPGANIKALQELESEFKELKLRAASYINSEEEEHTEEENLAVNETNNEPQTKTTERNEKALKTLSKKQLAEFEPKFDGYKVLSAGQDENGFHFCLISKEGDTAVYTMESADDLVDPKKIAKVDAQTKFAGNDWEMEVALDTITDDLSATIINANNELATAKEDLQTATNTINAMTEKEMKRRLSATKAKALSTLEEFNANRMEKVDAKILEKINEAIENGDFSECENADGDWNGEEEVANQVLAACAKAVMEMDKVAMQKNNSQYVWERVQNKAVDNGDVASLLSSIPLLNE